MVGQRLQALRVVAAQYSVVQRLKADAFFGQLTLEPLVAVEIELQAPRGIAAHFQERLAPVGVIQVEIVVVGKDRFVAREFEPHPTAGQAAGTEGIGFLLGQADEHDGVAHGSLLAHLVGPLVFAFLAPESKERDILALSEGFDLRDELTGNLAQQSGRGDGMPAMYREKTDQPGTMLELGYIAVEVEPVE